MSSLRLNFLQRGFVSALHKMSELSEGYTVGFLDELVRQHGILGFFKWAKGTTAVWNELAGRYGEKDAHMVASFASLWNGCDYCAYGHLLAFNLEHFQQTGELFPLDEQEIHQLLRMRDQEILAVVAERFSAAGQQHLAQLLQRQHQLKVLGGVAETEEDRYLLRAAALYEWVNECSIVAEAPAPPLGRIAKDRDLRIRYDEARRQQRTSPPQGTATLDGLKRVSQA